MAYLDVLGVDGVANIDNESKSRDQSGSGGNTGASAEGQICGTFVTSGGRGSHLNGMAALGMELLLVLQMMM